MKKYGIGKILIVLLTAMVMVTVVGAWSVPSLSGGKSNTPGNVLISE
jgi:hypothetical protein